LQGMSTEFHQDIVSCSYKLALLNFMTSCQADLEEVSTLYLDAKSSALLLQEQQEGYIT
jgi:hypothetical protein